MTYNFSKGGKWWQTSDEPFQTLAACIEVTAAMRSKDPAQFVSYFPTHQDGSCNGLQHYAALGRDQAGAESVNLSPFTHPQDVYSDVVDLVSARNTLKYNLTSSLLRLIFDWVPELFYKYYNSKINHKAFVAKHDVELYIPYNECSLMVGCF